MCVHCVVVGGDVVLVGRFCLFECEAAAEHTAPGWIRKLHKRYTQTHTWVFDGASRLNPVALTEFWGSAEKRLLSIPRMCVNLIDLYWAGFTVR